MKTIKLLGLFLVLIYSSACSQSSLDEYIKESSARICEELIYLGKNLDVTGKEEEWEFDHQNNIGDINCDEVSPMIVGTGDASQYIMIDRVVFRLNDQSEVIQITGRWRELTPKGQRTLKDFKESEYSNIHQESIDYMEMTTLFGNDIQKILYEIERHFGESTSIRPVTWEGENYSLDFGNSTSEFEQTYLVTVQEK